MNIPRHFIDLLLTRIDIVDLINAQLPLRKKSGNNYFTRCPFHTEKSASFSVSQPKQFFYCFGCGAHGNAIDFVMQHDRLPFPEAIEMLAKNAGLEVPQEKNIAKKQESLTSLYSLMEKAALYYYNNMRSSKRAIQYLKNRGISGLIAKTFQIGYADQNWRSLIEHFKTEHKKLLVTGLIIKKDESNYYDRFRDRIIFPIHDYRGRITGFGGRIIDQGEPKYLNSPETLLFQKGHELYGLYQALCAQRKLMRIILVEGYMDVIALYQHGITYAVATLGTATTAHHISRIARYTSEIIFAFDGDQAGQKAAERAISVIFPLMDDNLQIRFVFLPEGEDPDSLVRRLGKQGFEDFLKSATPLSTFFLDRLSSTCDMESLEGRARFAHLALEQIKLLPDNLFHRMLLEELSKRSRIALSNLSPEQKPTNKATSPATHLPTLPTPMAMVLSLLIKNPSLFKLLTRPEMYLKLPGGTFLSTLIEMLEDRPNITTGVLFEALRGQKEAHLLSKLLNLGQTIPPDGVENEFLGAIKQLNLLAFENEINTLLAKAAKEGLSDVEKKELAELIKSKKLLINKDS